MPVTFWFVALCEILDYVVVLGKKILDMLLILLYIHAITAQ
jgi:hypothetical protein